MWKPAPVDPWILLVACLQSSRERYRCFLRHAAQTSRLWVLSDARGWVSLVDPQGHHSLPVWPDATCARLCARGDWAASHEVAVDLHDFMGHWLSDMAALDVRVEVFPTPMRPGFNLSARQIQWHLRAQTTRNTWQPPGDAGWQETFPNTGGP